MHGDTGNLSLARPAGHFKTEFKENAREETKILRLKMLPPDAWVLIGMHLRPRYLAKLLQTSKNVQRLVDTNQYWTRVAAHQVWRTFEGMEIDDSPAAEDVLPRIEHNLMHMLGLEYGYFWTMELFFRRLDDVIAYYAVHDEQEYRSSWESLKPMSLEEKTRSWMIERVKSLQGVAPLSPSDAVERTMKEIAKNEIEDTNEDHDRRLNKFVCSMEDDPMPVAYKQAFFRKLDALLWGMIRTPKGDPTGSLHWGHCHTSLALAICKF